MPVSFRPPSYYCVRDAGMSWVTLVASVHAQLASARGQRFRSRSRTPSSRPSTGALRRDCFRYIDSLAWRTCCERSRWARQLHNRRLHSGLAGGVSRSIRTAARGG